MAKARYMPGRAVYGTMHRASRNARKARRDSPEVGFLGFVGFVIALVIFLA